MPLAQAAGEVSSDQPCRGQGSRGPWPWKVPPALLPLHRWRLGSPNSTSLTLSFRPL